MKISSVLIFLFVIVLPGTSIAQEDSSAVSLESSYFVDVYHAYDFSTSTPGPRQPFLYNHNTNNTISVNLALAQFTASSENFRANLGLMAGDYVRYNLAHEPVALRNLFEAYGGFKIGKVWIDAGIFGSNLGFESAISTDNITLTRSLVAENSPYYLSGVRCTFQPNEKWTFVGLISNGWQLIRDNNQYKAFGTQVTFSPSDDLTINSSTFIGDETIAGYQNMYFHDFYLTKSIGGKLDLIFGFDYGVKDQGNQFDRWYGTAFLTRIHLSEAMRIGLRAEYFSDPKGIVLSLPYDLDEEILGYSANFDWIINEYATFRTEFRRFHFISDRISGVPGLEESNSFLVTSLAFNF